jgi:hypothetical protein
MTSPNRPDGLRLNAVLFGEDFSAFFALERPDFFDLL